MRACVEALLVTGALLLAGCQTPARTGSGSGPSVVVTQDEEPEWRGVANREDAQRIAELSGAWREALTGVGRQARGEGRLLDPDAALPKPAPSPGSYMCRVIRLGSAKPREPAYQAFKPFFCHVGVNGEQLSITKQTGSQRPGGYLWDTDDTRRLVFLGTLALGTEDAPLAYGEDPARNMAGLFERYGDFRYRLVVPWPRQDSKLDVFELIPLPPQP